MATKTLALLLTCLFFLAHSGHIYPQDIIINPNNKNTPSDITLIFSLDTSLASTDYLRIVFPFRLNSIQPALWDYYNTCNASTPGMRAIVTPSTISGDSTSYFVQFYTDLTTTTLSNLTSNNTYYLKITGTPDPSAQTGINLPIQLLTVSNNLGNWVVYDSNPVFGTVTLADAFPSTMTVSIAIPSTEVDYTVLGNSYKVNIDITPKITLLNRARIDIQLTNSNFAFLSCKSLNSTAESIPLLPGTFDTIATNIIRATITKTLTAGNGAKYRFQCVVRNPTNIGTTKIMVKNRMGYIETVTESGTDNVGLAATTTTASATTTTSGWDETAHKVLLGWGYEAHLTSPVSGLDIFGLYKDASPTERWYQSVQAVFKPAADMTATTKLQVVVSTVNDASFKILAASIYHNLPDYSVTDTVTCSVITQGYLTCQNVGNLLATSYFVSFRFNILSTTTVNSVTDFGKVRVQTQATNPVDILRLSSTTLANKNIRTNVALYTSSSTNGIIAYSTAKTTSTTTKYVTNDDNIILRFAFKYFTNSIIQLSLTNMDKGIEFYTSPQLGGSTTPTCTISTLTQTTDVIINNCAVEQLTSYTRLRFRIQNFARVGAGTPPYNLFTSTVLDGTVNFDSVRFTATQFSSLNYVSSNVFDYYARWVQDFTNSATANTKLVTGSSPFFFNSLVHKNGALANVNVGTTFFVTGATVTDPSNDGSTFPTLIRVTGYLTTGASGEQTGTDRLLVFFNDLEPLNPTNPCSGPSGIVCKYVANGVENTQTNTLTDYSGSRRIEIKIDFTQHFNIYIPVKTISQKASIGFFVTTASAINAVATNQGIFATQHSKRIDQYTSTATTITIDPVAASTPKISVTGSPTMGTVVDTSIGNLQAAYIQTTPNSGTNVGAAYAYCADYDFTKNAAFTFKAFYSSSAVPEQYCVTVKYSPSTTTDVTCQVCPVHSAMTTTAMAVSKLTLPTKAGRDFFDLTYVMGSMNGDFKKAAKDGQATVLTAFMLSSLSITFTPTDFKKASKNVYARISFTTIAPLPKAIRINIIPTGSSTSLLINPVSSVPCIVNTTTATSCVTSGSTTNIQIDAVASGNTWATGNHKIDFMIDADSTAAAILADTTINFKATIKVNGLTALSALHHDSTATTFVIKNAASVYIGLYNITYLFGNKDARSIISFVFELPADIMVYPTQTIVFNLGGIATANVGVTPICLVKNPGTNLTSNDFASCDVSDLSQLTLQAKATVSGNYTLELQYIHVPSSAAPGGISAKVYAADGSTIVAQNLPSNPLTLPQTPASKLIPVLSVNLDRLYSDPGSVSEIILSVKPSVQAISLASHVYMYFPPYYADKLGYQNGWCTANDYPVACELLASRIVHLSSFPVEVPVGQTLKIRIYGVITPVVPSTSGKIFIGIAATSSVFTLTEQIEVNDKASNGALPNTLTIDGLSLTTTKIRETGDITIVFTTDAVGIRTTRRIAIDFPDRYGNILGGNDPPVILLSKTGDIITTPTSIQSTSIGSRYKITPPYDLLPKTSYTFLIKSIDNPEQPICNMDKPMITITDSTESYAISRTAPNIWNVPRVDYASDVSLKSLSWNDKNGNGMIIIPLSIGIFSPEIRIVPPTGETFANDVSFTNSNTQLSTLPTSVIGAKGTPYVSLRVAAASTVFPRILLLDMKKDETYTTNVYSQLPKLQLILTNTKNTLAAQIIRIVKGGTSLPYRWELDTLDLIPHTELKIDATINQPTLSPLAVLGASSISLGPSTPKAGFTFTLTAAADPLNPPSFTLTLGGQDSANYLLENKTITVKVEAPNTVAPVLSNVVAAVNYSPISEQFSLESDQMASVYWHVAYEGKLMTQDCLRVRSKYNEGFTYDTLSETQAQVGVFWIYNENVASLQTISNLLSNEKYSYILCPTNQLDVVGAPTTGVFQTKDNQARLSSVTINFKQALTTAQVTSMVCLFTRELQLPDLNVAAMDGTTCAVPSILSDKSSFDYKSLTIYINGDRRSIFDSVTLATLTQDVDSVSKQNTSSFLTTFNQALRGAGLTGQYSSISMASNVIYSLPTFPTTDYNASTTIWDTNVTVTGLRLTSGAGMFYAIATEDTTAVPTTEQIKAKQNGKSVTVSGGNVIYSSGSASITLSGLKANSDYMIYYFGTTPDKTQYARTTDVKYLKIKTKPTIETSAGARTEVSIFMMLVVAMVAWFL